MNGRRALSIRRAGALLAVMLVAGLLLAAQPLRGGAEEISSPALRAVALTVVWPFAKVGDGLHVENGRQWVLHAFDEGQAEAAGDTETATLLIADPGRPSGPAPSDPVPSGPQPGDAGPATSTTAASSVTSTTATAKPNPRFDEKRPLHILVVGDSLVKEVAYGLARVSKERPVEIDYRFKVSSGLVNTAFFDWPAEVKRLMPRFDPDVTVMMYGSNDRLSLRVDGEPVAPFKPEWLEEYGSRVKAIADVAERAGSRVVWVGMPVMRSDSLSQTARTLNQVYAKVCKEEGYSFVDAYRLLSDHDGEYAAYLPNASGKSQAVREGDGIHLAPAGGDRVAREIFRILDRHFLIES